MCNERTGRQYSIQRREAETDGTKPEKVQYCDVNWDQLLQVQEYSDGKEVIIWFQARKRIAWPAHSVMQKSENRIDNGNSQQTLNAEG
jgi:hypothetical protein